MRGIRQESGCEWLRDGPDLSGADVHLRDERERDALRDRHTEWSPITLGGKVVRCGSDRAPEGRVR
jgi:hypothetical protein